MALRRRASLSGLAVALVVAAAAWLPFGEVDAFGRARAAPELVVYDAAEPLRTLNFLEGIAPIAAAASGVLAGIANLGVVANNPYIYSNPWYGYRPGPVYAPGFGYGFGFPYVYGRNAAADLNLAV